MDKKSETRSSPDLCNAKRFHHHSGRASLAKNCYGITFTFQISLLAPPYRAIFGDAFALTEGNILKLPADAEQLNSTHS